MTNEFLQYALEILEPFKNVTSRRMFSGYSIYKNRIIFAIVVNGTLYFKVDKSNISDYKALDSEPFTYQRKKDGRVITMSYWQVPISIMEDSQEILQWAKKSYKVSLLSKST